MDEKRFRFDLYIAAAALIFSGLAAGAAAYQTYVIRQQFSATVWPYLVFITSKGGDRWFELDVSNVGIGPALIRDATVTRDGKVIPESVLPNAMTAFGTALNPERQQAADEERRTHSHEALDMTSSSISRGDVIPAGNKLQLLRIAGSPFTRRVIAEGRRVDLSICYCSLLGNCWTRRLWDPSSEPHAIRSCPT
ncbi:MAG TPA: hypothetical protein VGF18_00315 [Candidatus Tumulicola sp.]|jgi:hypothetical protein